MVTAIRTTSASQHQAKRSKLPKSKKIGYAIKIGTKPLNCDAKPGVEGIIRENEG